MQIKLIEMTIQNFKGIKDFKLEPKGENIWIKGENGTGKTTLADAFFWLFSGSNSEQRSNFNAIPLDQAGNAINHREATVEAVIKAGRKNIRLKKVYRQVWQKRRGSESNELTGHTTDHYFDEVPVSKSDYEKRLNDLVRLDLFRSLADIKHFCSATSPQYRRNILLEVTGNITDQDVIDANEDIKELPEILNERSTDDYLKVLNQNRRAINHALKEIPAQIKERLHGRPDMGNIRQHDIESEIDQIERAISESQQRIAELGTGVDQARLKSKLIQFQTQLDGIEAKIRNKHAEKIQGYVDRNREMAIELTRMGTDFGKTFDEIKRLESSIIADAEKLTALKANWDSEDKKKFKPTKVCFACGQPIPDGAVRMQEVEFEKSRCKVLDSILAEGDAINARKKSFEQKLEVERKHADLINFDIQKTKEQIELNNQAMEQIEKDIISEIDHAAAEIRIEMDEISAEIEKLNSDTGPQRKKIEDSIALMDESKKELNTELDKIVRAAEIDERVAQLEYELKAQGKALERNAYESDLIDKFLRYKAEYIERSVSGHFSITEWKLFEDLIGGGYKDICEPLFEGVPFNIDLNKGARINVGLDVIATLSRHYKTTCPIFLDNAESITGWIPTDSQIIRLVAKAGVKELMIDRCDHE